MTENSKNNPFKKFFDRRKQKPPNPSSREKQRLRDEFYSSLDGLTIQNLKLQGFTDQQARNILRQIQQRRNRKP